MNVVHHYASVSLIMKKSFDAAERLAIFEVLRRINKNKTRRTLTKHLDKLRH